MNEVTKECRLCGSTGPHQTISVREMMFGTREQFEYYCCAACDTLQRVNVPDDEELKRYYPPNYGPHKRVSGVLRWLITQQDHFELHSGGRLVGALIAALSLEDIIHALIGGDEVGMLGQLGLDRDARILDVGCGSGELLDRLARVGFNKLSGVDPFFAADDETPRGVPLMKGYLGEVPGEFDLIMFNHSLEHVPDPIATLKVAYEKLAAGGICLVRLPTTSSETWTIYGADWVMIEAPRHIVIPSRRGMALAADRAGLRVETAIDDSTLDGFFGSEACRHDIAFKDPKMLWEILKIFGPKQIWDWKKRAEWLNRQGRGDQAGFVLRAK